MNSLPAGPNFDGGKQEFSPPGSTFGVENQVSASAASPQAHRILFIDEDAALAGFLGSELRNKGFEVDHLVDSEKAFSKLEDGGRWSLLILELNLTGTDGISLIQRARAAFPKLPILVVTSRTRIEDKVKALYCGADDCLTKPLSLLELFARIAALLRRTNAYVDNCSMVSDLCLYREERRVERNGKRIELTPREFALLDVMMQNAGRPVPRTTLLERVWNIASQPSTNIVDVYMKYVRDKVDGPGQSKLIHTVRGFGYELRPA